MSSAEDTRWLRRALRLAQKFEGMTAPNPAVGCVIVKNGRVVGQGAHKRAGGPHAEIHALAMAGTKAKGATAYVTLEPCCHHGKTPPCVDALIAAKIARVVYGVRDPNPKVSGKGIARLRKAGIRVEAGPLADDCADLIADFRVWMTARRPYVIYKVAATWDGATAHADIHGKALGGEAITGEVTRRLVHKLRATCDAVLVGANTYRLDDPDLRPRLAKSAKRPWRVVVASTLPKPRGKLLTVEPESTLWIVAKANARDTAAWRKAGSRVIELTRKPTPEAILQELWNLGVYRVLLEGGATLAGSFLQARRIDHLIVIHGPSLAGNTPVRPIFQSDQPGKFKGPFTFRPKSVNRVGEDIWTEGRIGYQGRSN